MKQNDTNAYRKKAGHLLKQGLLGYLVGLAVTFALVLDSGSIFLWPFLGLPFAGIPYGWVQTGRFFGTVVGTIPIMVIAFMLRLTAAYILGLFVYPVVLLYCLIRGYLSKCVPLQNTNHK